MLTPTSTPKEKAAHAKKLDKTLAQLRAGIAKVNTLCKSKKFDYLKKKDTTLEEVAKLNSKKEAFLAEVRPCLPFLDKVVAQALAQKSAQLILEINEVAARMHCLSQGMVDAVQTADMANIIGIFQSLIIVDKRTQSADLNRTRQRLQAQQTTARDLSPTMSS